MIEEQPRDWNTRNTLGDLYVRANQPDKAVAQYTQIADHLFTEGFFPKAAALYKKILKIKPDEESVQLHLGEISAKQGLLADAKALLHRRRQQAARRAATAPAPTRSSSASVRWIPSDFDARALAAQALEQQRRRRRRRDACTARCTPTCSRRGAPTEAIRRAARGGPAESRRRRGARRAGAGGDRGRRSRGRQGSTSIATIAGEDPALLMPLMEIELRAGHDGRGARDPRAAAAHRRSTLRAQIVELAWTLGAGRHRRRRSSASTRRSTPSSRRATTWTPRRSCRNS